MTTDSPPDPVDHDAELGRLLAASVAGDRRAFEELVDRHKNRVWSIIGLLGIRRPEADDIFQLVFIRLYEHQASIREPSRLQAWLTTTTKRECYQSFRRRQRTASTIPLIDDLLEVEHAVDFDADLLEDDRRRVVAEAFTSLSPRCQGLIRLLATDPPLSYDEISELLDMPRGSIGPTRQRCLDVLRRHPAVLRRISEETS